MPTEWPKVTEWCWLNPQNQQLETKSVTTYLGNRTEEEACAEHDLDVIAGKKEYTPTGPD